VQSVILRNILLAMKLSLRDAYLILLWRRRRLEKQTNTATGYDTRQPTSVYTCRSRPPSFCHHWSSSVYNTSTQLGRPVLITPSREAR